MAPINMYTTNNNIILNIKLLLNWTKDTKGPNNNIMFLIKTA